jgi:Tol biopolymer transport system component
MKNTTLILFNILLITSSMAGCASFQKGVTNGKIVFQSTRDGNYDLYIMNPDGSDQQNLTNSPPSVANTNNNTSPVPSPDGKQVAFVSERDGNDEIYTIDLESKVQLNLTKNKASDFSPTWSPDGKHIAFISDRDAILLDANQGLLTNNIYIMDADGSNTRKLTNGNKTNGYSGLAWSPDGKKLAFSLSLFSPYVGFFSNGINLMSLSDTSLTRLTFDQSTDQSRPKWSPDGNHIVYLVSASKLSNIYVMNADGTDQVALSKDPSILDIDPSWSPDGKQIVFSSRRDGAYHIYTMNADDSSNQRPVTNGSGEERLPVWLPMP